MNGPFSFRTAPEMWKELHTHLFPGDRSEHGAVIAASVLSTPRGTRLLAHKLFLARDGIDYLPGQRGHRMLTATFVMDCALECAELGMAYLAVHCHGGNDQVRFSGTDLASHERGYAALLDIVDGPPVGALVFAPNAVAGHIWLPGGDREPLEETVVAGRPILRFDPSPRRRPRNVDGRYDRQARLFGDRGQHILSSLKIGIIGAGGAGSLVNQYLAHLGIGEIVIVDPDRIERSNLTRVVGSHLRDIRSCLTSPRIPTSIRRRLDRFRKLKVSIGERVARQAHPAIRYTAVAADVTTQIAVNHLVDCDYLVLAADTMQARLVFNALVHQYLIPGIQMGVKAQVDQETGKVDDLFVAVRPVLPAVGCLWCNGLISPANLQEEATSHEQRRRQRYVEDDDIPAPSVITLNAIGASHAASDFLMSMTGLQDENELTWSKHYPRSGQSISEHPRRDVGCRECSVVGRLGRGPTHRLPVRA